MLSIDDNGKQTVSERYILRCGMMCRSFLPVRLVLCFVVCALCWSDTGEAKQQSGDLESTSGGRRPVLLQLRSDVEVASFVVLVGDVLAPVGTPPDRWQELSRKAIGLLPSDGRRLRMERQRISECLERSGLLEQQVRWSGPEYVSIAYVPRETPMDYRQQVSQASVSYHTSGNRSSVVQASLGTVDPNDITAARTIERLKPAHPNLFPAERNRIERMILAALPKTHAEVLERFQVEIPDDDQGINALKDLRAVRSLRLSQAPQAGRIQLWVSGEKELQEVEATVDIELTELPVVIYTTTALNRGDIISPRDLIAKPIPLGQYDAKFVSDLDLLVNKEVMRPLSMNRPVTQQDVGEPIIIKRGDRVVLRVVGAGVLIATEARALAPAAEGESVMVETEEPKQKLVARAVRTGVVEIVSRPPTIE